MSGYVRDAGSSAPLAGATVQAQGQSTVSEADGRYSFERLSFDSSLTITARREGYRDYSETLNAIPANAAYGIFRDIRMTRQ